MLTVTSNTHLSWTHTYTLITCVVILLCGWVIKPWQCCRSNIWSCWCYFRVCWSLSIRTRHFMG